MYVGVIADRAIHNRFIFLYAIANIGSSIAFLPLLVLLLPARVAAMSGPHQDVRVMSVLLLIGAVVASLANILGGAVGDRWLKRTGSRRGLIAIGLAGVIASYAGFAEWRRWVPRERAPG